MKDEKTQEEVAKARSKAIEEIKSNFKNSKELRKIKEQFEKDKLLIFNQIVKDVCESRNESEENIRIIMGWNQ
jgi:hypothetical protein